MNSLDRILNLIEKKKITDKQFLFDLGLGTGALSEWKKGKSKSYTKYIYQIAEYLGTSVSYLMCETDDPTPAKKKNSAGESEESPVFITLHRHYSKLPAKDREKMDKKLKVLFDELFPDDE